MFLRHPSLHWLYWDSDEIGPDGHPHRPRLLFAPDPDLILATDWTVVSGAFRTAALRQARAAATAAPTGDHHEAGLMVFEHFGLEAIRHLPAILHHRLPLPRGETLSRSLQRQRAVRAHLERTAQTAIVTADHHTPGVQIRYALPQPEPMVSIIIATRDRFDLLARCIDSIEHHTDYPRYEVLIVDNGSKEPETLAYLAALQRQGLARVIRHDGPFNWSALNNAAAGMATGSVLCLLNNDVEVISTGWLRELVAQVSRPGIGAAGAILWYPDNKLQHAGVALMPARTAPRAMKPPGAIHAYARDVDRLAVPENDPFHENVVGGHRRLPRHPPCRIHGNQRDGGALSADRLERRRLLPPAQGEARPADGGDAPCRALPSRIGKPARKPEGRIATIRAYCGRAGILTQLLDRPVRPGSPLQPASCECAAAPPS